MSLIKRLLRALGYPRTRKLSFRLEEEWLRSLKDISEREQRSAEDIAADMLEEGLLRWRGDVYEIWNQLSRREKEVTALTCLDYTNSQIAARLGLSRETIRSHLTHIRRKFDVSSKAELKSLLSHWDFAEWE